MDGCCWGTITAGVPYVIYTDPRGSMPMLGVPVHPVQLYEALMLMVLGAFTEEFSFERLKAAFGAHVHLNVEISDSSGTLGRQAK